MPAALLPVWFLRLAALRPAWLLRLGHDRAQIGCNGVDNGALWFDNVRVPREALLNATSEVNPDGSFASKVSPLPLPGALPPPATTYTIRVCAFV